MSAQKKIIKADTVREMGSRVEKLELEGRRFGEKVFKKLAIDNHPVELEAEYPEELVEEPGEKKTPEVRLEKAFDEAGNLSGVRIHCKCGELIELEFTQD